MKKPKILLKYLIIILIIFNLISCISVGPDVSTVKFLEFDITDANKYQISLTKLYEKLVNVHTVITPNKFKYIDIEEFNKVSLETFNKLGEIENDKIGSKKLRYSYLVNKVFSLLKDGHTYFELISHHFPSPEPLIPIIMKWFEDKLYIVGTINNNDHLLNKEILKIGNKNIYELRDEVNKYISSENEYNKLFFNGFYMCKGVILDYLGLLYDKNKVDIEYLDKGEIKTITLEVKEYTNIISLFNNLMDVGKNKITKYTGTGIIKYKEIPEYQAMYLKLNAFSDSTTNQNNNYYFGVILEDKFNEMFMEMKEKNLDKLIIDIRNNLGGYIHLSYKLLGHIKNDYDDFFSFSHYYKPSKEYYNYYANHNPSDYQEEIEKGELLFGGNFGSPVDVDELWEGKVYVLVSSYSFSMASWFAAIIKDNNYGIVLGEPTGSGSISHRSGIRIKVPKLNMSMQLTCTLSIRDNVEARKREIDIIYPDIYIPTSFDAYLNGKDPVWDYLEENYLKSGTK